MISINQSATNLLLLELPKGYSVLSVRYWLLYYQFNFCNGPIQRKAKRKSANKRNIISNKDRKTTQNEVWLKVNFFIYVSIALYFKKKY